jgi:hypothetical protein
MTKPQVTIPLDLHDIYLLKLKVAFLRAENRRFRGCDSGFDGRKGVKHPLFSPLPDKQKMTVFILDQHTRTALTCLFKPIQAEPMPVTVGFGKLNCKNWLMNFILPSQSHIIRLAHPNGI